MAVKKLLPQAQAYGYELGVLLLNLVETHVPGDTAHVGTYDYPVLFHVVPEATVDKVTLGDRSIEPAVIAAARHLEVSGVKAISSNCGFFLHYQEAVRNAVNIPVVMSSLLQLPLIQRMIRGDKRIAILTAFTDRLTPEVLALAGLSSETPIAVESIQNTPQFLNMAQEDLDTDAFLARLQEAGDQLFAKHGDIGALLLECAVFTPYAKALQRRLDVPVFDFVSLINYAHSVTWRR